MKNEAKIFTLLIILSIFIASFIIIITKGLLYHDPATIILFISMIISALLFRSITDD